MATRLKGHRFKKGEIIHIDYYKEDKNKTNKYVLCTYIKRLENNNILVHFGTDEEYEYTFEISFNSDNMYQYDAITGEYYGTMHCTKVYTTERR